MKTLAILLFSLALGAACASKQKGPVEPTTEEGRTGDGSDDSMRTVEDPNRPDSHVTPTGPGSGNRPNHE